MVLPGENILASRIDTPGLVTINGITQSINNLSVNVQ
jgi:hypothetical protein